MSAPVAAGTLRVAPAQANLLIVDVQEKLAAAMPPEAWARCERNILTLVELARRLRLPVVVSEQYPKGLGPTVASVAGALAGPDLQLQRIEKLTFSCTDAPTFAPILQQRPAAQWIVVGMEAHVCVYQTARGLAERGAPVQVPADAVVSRTDANARIGLGLIERAGGIVTATETVVFDALGTAGTDDFRALSKLIR